MQGLCQMQPLLEALGRCNQSEKLPITEKGGRPGNEQPCKVVCGWAQCKVGEAYVYCLYMVHADQLVGQAIKIEHLQNKGFVMLTGRCSASVAAAGDVQQS